MLDELYGTPSVLLLRRGAGICVRKQKRPEPLPGGLGSLASGSLLVWNASARGVAGLLPCPYAGILSGNCEFVISTPLS
jgi:hypothetical protein